MKNKAYRIIDIIINALFIFVKFCKQFSYKQRVGRSINLFIFFFKMAIKIAGSALQSRVSWISENTGFFVCPKQVFSGRGSKEKEVTVA